MTSTKTKFNIGKRTIFIILGWDWKRFGLGFRISKWGIDLDLSLVWLSIEWWYNDSEI